MFAYLMLVAFGSAVMSAYVADEKNRSGIAWFILGFLFPILALIAIGGVPPKEKS